MNYMARREHDYRMARLEHDYRTAVARIASLGASLAEAEAKCARAENQRDGLDTMLSLLKADLFAERATRVEAEKLAIEIAEVLRTRHMTKGNSDALVHP